MFLFVVKWLREHQQKTFVMWLSGFLSLKEWGGGGQGLSESVKKGKFVTKIFFADIVE